jgi:hypothetical protein
VAIANVYMSSFGRLRQEVKSEKLEAKKKERDLEDSPIIASSSSAPSASGGKEGTYPRPAVR